MRETSGVAATVVSALAEAKIELLLINTSETEISFLIERVYEADALSAVAKLT